MDFKIEDFISHKKSMLISPAGYGKTYTIAECVAMGYGKSLILTHTNAGVAALKNRLKTKGVPSAKYHIETISGYAQKYIKAYIPADKIPQQDQSSKYYPFIIKTATSLFKNDLIGDIIRNSYKRMFVDEYQDCTLSQHQFIVQLSNYLNTHILGDPMQGIFDFIPNDPIVNLEDDSMMGDFSNHKYELETPWRWINSGIPELGNQLKLLRTELETTKATNIDYTKYSHIKEYSVTDRTSLREIVNEIFRNYSDVLFIHHNTINISKRISFVQFTNNAVYLIEAIDNKIFYELSKTADAIIPDLVVLAVRNICYPIFAKTEIDKWLGEYDVRKRKGEYAKDALLLDGLINKAKESSRKSDVANIIEWFSSYLHIPIYRKDLYYSMIRALRLSDEKQISAFDAMCDVRNNIRRAGRNIKGRCIGTTLLTKGLECECVVLLGSNCFVDYKHLYVALTRGSKDIICLRIT